MGAFEYTVRERDAPHGRAVGTYAHAAGEAPPVQGAVIVVVGKMWRIVEVPDEKPGVRVNTLIVEPFADPS